MEAQSVRSPKREEEQEGHKTSGTLYKTRCADASARTPHNSPTNFCNFDLLGSHPARPSFMARRRHSRAVGTEGLTECWSTP